MSLSRSRAVICARARMDSNDIQARSARTEPQSQRRYWPIWHLTISRMRVFYREPAAVFWVYGFPLVMAMSLGTAFRDNPQERISVDVIESKREGEAPAEPLASNLESQIQNLKSLLSS